MTIQAVDNEISVDSESLMGDRVRYIYTGDRYMQINLTENIKAIFGELFSDRYTQGDRYI